MNDTKWNELRLGMHSLGDKRPRWRTRDIDTGYVSGWDADWYYHFRIGEYRTIEWLDIAIRSPEQRNAVLEVLVRVHVPGEQTDDGFRVFGYAPAGSAVTYIVDAAPARP